MFLKSKVYEMYKENNTDFPSLLSLVIFFTRTPMFIDLRFPGIFAIIKQQIIKKPQVFANEYFVI